MSIVVDRLVKEFGIQKAVDGISFQASPGEITGFLGPNGAGKSTTMKIATGYLQASSGQVLIQGKEVSKNPHFAKKNIGYLPEHNPLYMDMYVREFLRFIGKSYGITNLKKNVERTIQLTGLENEKHKKIKALSKGYRQRVGLAQALLPDTDVLILDEPTTGLDPNQLVEIRKVIKNVSAEKTLIFSTHIMQEVEAICDRVVIISKGRIVANDTLANLRKKSKNNHSVQVTFESHVPKEVLLKIKGVNSVSLRGRNSYEVSSVDVNLKSLLLKEAAKENWPIEGIKSSGGSLEEIFRTLTGNPN